MLITFLLMKKRPSLESVLDADNFSVYELKTMAATAKEAIEARDHGVTVIQDPETGYAHAAGSFYGYDLATNRFTKGTAGFFAAGLDVGVPRSKPEIVKDRVPEEVLAEATVRIGAAIYAHSNGAFAIPVRTNKRTGLTEPVPLPPPGKFAPYRSMFELVLHRILELNAQDMALKGAA